MIKFDKKLIDKILITNLINTINKLKKFNIPYNKTYDVINEYYYNELNSIFKFNQNIKCNLINVDIKNKSILEKFGRYSEFKYLELSNYENDNYIGFIIKNKFLKKNFNDNKLPLNVKIISEGFTRGVSNYINNNYKIKNFKITNAYVKLWEIFKQFQNY